MATTGPSEGGASRLLAAVRTAVAVLRGSAPVDDAHTWSHTEREEVITGLDLAIQDLTLYRGGVLLAHKEDGRWGVAGDRDFTDWRARATGAGRGPARGELEVAETLKALPDVAKAVEDGEVTLEHAKAFARVRSGASEAVRDAFDNGAATELLEKARTLSAPELAKEAKKVAGAIDAEAAQRDFDAAWQSRSVRTRRTAGRCTGEWALDRVGGALVETALDAITGTPAKGDLRTREQRHADALVTMASRVLQAGADLNGAQVRPHLAIVVSEETWSAVRRRRAAIDHANAAAVDDAHGWSGAAFGLGPDGLPLTLEETLDGTGVGSAARTIVGSDGVELPAPAPWPNVPPAELEDGSLVPLGELERLMCDCELTRVVMDAGSVPLDVGQTARTYTKELRRAITTRDRKCQWPGCGIRAAWSEVHHIRWFSHGGPTSLENGITVCTFHHHRIHQLNVRIQPVPNGFDFFYADGRHLGRTLRAAAPRRGPTSPVDDLTPRSTADGVALLSAWPPRPDGRDGALERGHPSPKAGAGDNAQLRDGPTAPVGAAPAQHRDGHEARAEKDPAPLGGETGTNVPPEHADHARRRPPPHGREARAHSSPHRPASRSSGPKHSSPQHVAPQHSSLKRSSPPSPDAQQSPSTQRTARGHQSQRRARAGPSDHQPDLLTEWERYVAAFPPEPPF